MKFWVLGLCVAAVWAKPPRDPSLALVRQVTGNATVADRDTSVTTQLKFGDLVPSGRTLATGSNGVLILRFHPDFMRIEARANSRYVLGYARLDTTKARQIRLDAGELVLGVPKHSPPLDLEDAHSRVHAEEARFSFATDAQSASTLIVLDGSIEVHNRAKDVSGTVRRGQKCVSDDDGLHITDATDSELSQVGLRQNTLEVDFWNPQTGEFSTLEVEYESNF